MNEIRIGMKVARRVARPARPALLVLLALVLGAVLLPLGALQAQARSADVDRARVERALLAIEGRSSVRFWATLDEGGRAALFALLDDRARPPMLRRRAVSALRHLDGPEARSRLLALAEDEGEDPLVSRYALAALVALDPHAALAAVEGALRSPRAEVRAGALSAVPRLVRARVLAPERSRLWLLAARDREPDPGLRADLEHALTLSDASGR